MAMLRPASELKDSGIEWIGKIPTAWKLNKIKYVSGFNPLLSVTYDEKELVGYIPMDSVKNGYMMPLKK